MSALEKVTNALKAKTASIKRAAEKNQQQIAVAAGAGAGVVSALGAGLLDAKLGESGQPHKLFDTIPTKAAIGVVLAVPCFFLNKHPILQAGLAGSAGSMVQCAMYRYVVDNTPAAEPKAP